jgi:hypothetical protein
MADLIPALELKVGEPGAYKKHRVGRCARSAKHGKRERAVRRNSRNAAVLKLNLRFSAIGCRELRAFK